MAKATTREKITRLLEQYGAMTVAQLSASTGASKGLVFGTLAKMEKKGEVKRDDAQIDGRFVFQYSRARAIVEMK